MQKFIPLIILGLAGAALSGCGDSSSPTGSTAAGPVWVQGTAADRAEVAAQAALHPEFMEDAVYESDAPMSDQAFEDPSTLSAQAAINPITFSRSVRVVGRSFEYAFADTDSVGRPTRAFLTVTRELEGSLRIVAQDTTGSFNPPHTVRKAISETWTRRLEFARDTSRAGGGGGDDDDDDDDDDDGGSAREMGRDVGSYGGHGQGGGRNRSRWELVAVSGIEVSTNGEAEIVSVRFAGATLDTTISDALDLIPVGGLPTLPPGSEVTVTVTTNAADDIVLLLSRGGRQRLHSDGANTYSGTFVVPESFGCHHFGVNAMTHETLYDDEAAYDSETWTLPVLAGSSALARAK